MTDLSRPGAPAAPAQLPTDGGAPRRGRPGPWVLLAAWGPCGYLPLAPGTWGTLGAMPLAWALRGLLALAVRRHHRRPSSPWPSSPPRTPGATGASTTPRPSSSTRWSATSSPWPSSPGRGAPPSPASPSSACFDVVKPWPASAGSTGSEERARRRARRRVRRRLWRLLAMELLKLALRHAAGCADARWWCQVISDDDLADLPAGGGAPRHRRRAPHRPGGGHQPRLAHGPALGPRRDGAPQDAGGRRPGRPPGGAARDHRPGPTWW